MRSTGTKLNSQIERTINRKIQTSLEMFKNVLFHLRLTEWSVFTLILVVLNSKYFSSDEKTTTNKNALQENVRTSWISFSLSQNSHRTTQTQSTNRKARIEPVIRDAQKLAQNVFPPWRPTLTSRNVQSIAQPFQKLSREVFGNTWILIFYLSLKAWEEKSLPKSHLGWFYFSV